MLLVAIFTAVALFMASALVIVAITNRSATTARLLEVESRGVSSSTSVGDKVRGVVSTLTRPLTPLRSLLAVQDENLSYRLALAGYRKPNDAELFLTFKLLTPVTGVLVATFLGSGNLVLWVLILGAIGYFGPDLALTQMIARRRDKLRVSLPDAIDLLVICMDAGLGLDQALIRVAQELQSGYPDLSDELMMITREQSAGKPRIDAWRSMADRTDLDIVRQLVAMLVQTERFGTPIARALGQFADSLRLKRMFEAEEMAAKTTVKLIFPIVLFIFPGIFVVLLGPAAITMMRSLGQN